MFRHEAVGGAANEDETHQESYGEPDVGKGRISSRPAVEYYKVTRDVDEQEE